MTFLAGPAVVLGPIDCARLDGLLVRALVDAKLRGNAVPPAVRALAADIHQVAEQFRAEVLIRPDCATYGLAVDAETAVWEPEERLSTAQAARIVGVSPQYMRRVFAAGGLDAIREPGGGWSVSGLGLALWIAARHQREAAGDGRRRREVLRGSSGLSA